MWDDIIATVLGFLILVSIFAIPYGIYAFLFKYPSITTVQITVNEKWIKGVGEHGQKYLIGTDNEVFENTDEILVLKFNSSDFWNQIEEGKTYDATVIGWRIPFLSWYRNIIDLEEVD